jgi:Flp pilus assembly protein TadG
VKALKARLHLPRWHKDESGVAMFEYAIALPVFMMLVFFAVAIVSPEY